MSFLNRNKNAKACPCALNHDEARNTPPSSPPHHQTNAPSSVLPATTSIPAASAPPRATTWKPEQSSVPPTTTALPLRSQPNTQASVLPEAAIWKAESSSISSTMTALPARSSLAPATLPRWNVENRTKLPPPTKFEVERSEMKFSVLPPKSDEAVLVKARKSGLNERRESRDELD